jgi:hypothetical protein
MAKPKTPMFTTFKFCHVGIVFADLQLSYQDVCSIVPDVQVILTVIFILYSDHQVLICRGPRAAANAVPCLMSKLPAANAVQHCTV